MDLIECPVCGEQYSPTYARCPFCEEDRKPDKPPKRRLTSRKKAQSARGALIAVLLAVLALLGWYLFGGRKPAEPTLPPAAETDEPTVPAVNVDPFYEEPNSAGQTDPAAPEQPGAQETADVSNAALNQSDFTLTKGEKYTIKLTGTEAEPTWSIDNPNVATVAADGTVTAVADGDTTARCKVGTRELTCTVRVRNTGKTAAAADAPMTAQPVTPVAPEQPSANGNTDVLNAKLNRSDFTLARGETFRLKLTGTEAAPTWSVDAPNVATVAADGTVTAVGAGWTTVRCKAGERELTCIVRVK